MSIIHPTDSTHKNVDQSDCYASLSPREYLLGTLVVMLIILLAILLRSL